MHASFLSDFGGHSFAKLPKEKPKGFAYETGGQDPSALVSEAVIAF